jgi:tetrapyrrole methylase family protein/MazG family protein
MNYPNLEELIKTIEILRSENGCEWDREQTHESLRRNMIEEAYEAVDAIDDNDCNHLKEELGDVLLQVVLHSQIAKEYDEFTIEDVAKEINKKLIHRHPHVFGDVKVNNTQEILDNWEELKKKEKPHRTSIMDGISKAQAALMSAQKISKKAVKVGFEWQNEEQLIECLLSELKEFQEAKSFEHKEEELGDLLFAVVNLARWNKIDAEQALLKSNKKFMQRFRTMENLATKNLEDLSFEEWDSLWKSAKMHSHSL